MSLLDNSPIPLGLSRTATDHLSTEYFRVKDFGFLRLTTTEKSGAIFYPTPSDYVAPGWFTLDIHASNFGDFNGDGLQDLLILPMLFNHRLPRTTKIDPLF